MEAQLIHLIRQACGDEPKHAIYAVRLLAGELPWLEQHAVVVARRSGWSWARIARGLGRTRQSVWERYGQRQPPRRRDDDLTVYERESRARARTSADIRRELAIEDGEVVAW
jgi:hypothetical protein